MNITRRYIFLLLGIFSVFLFLGAIHSVFAQPISVTACSTGGDYSTIQAAIDAVPAGGDVEACEEAFVETLIVNKSLTLRGSGSDATTIMPNTDMVVGNNAAAIHIVAGVTVTIKDLAVTTTVTECCGPFGSGIENRGALTARRVDIYGNGRGLLNQGGDLTITDSRIRENRKSYFRNDGSGIQNIGGTLRVVNSTIQDNSMSGPDEGSNDGAGIYSDGIAFIIESIIRDNAGAAGGGIYNLGEMTIKDSVVLSNFSLYQGGGILNKGELLIERTTLSENYVSAPIFGGTCGAGGGGIANYNRLEITDSLVHSNSAGDAFDADETCYGGGIYNGGAAASAFIKNSTISQNYASCRESDCHGGGIANEEGASMELLHVTLYQNKGGGLSNITYSYDEQSSNITISQSIIAESIGAPDCQNIDSDTSSLGHNIDSDGSCELDATGDQPTVDPSLGPLQDNGGPTLTHALLSGSPAVDASTNVNCPAADQRGVSRPQGDTCDIGAFELEAVDSTPQISGNVDCDNDLDAIDALFVLQYAVDQRSESGGCPLADSETQLDATRGDMNNDGVTDAVDALFILQCVVNIQNEYCGLYAASLQPAKYEDSLLESLPSQLNDASHQLFIPLMNR